MSPMDSISSSRSTTSWADVVAEAPELAGSVVERFAAHRHHVLATLRRDGSPRVSGTEVTLLDGELWLGSMWMARKAADLRRDPRCAVHAHTGDGSMDDGDAKLDAVAEELEGERREEVLRRLGAPPGPAHLFLLHPVRVVVTGLNGRGDGIVVRSWSAGGHVVEVDRT